MGNRGFFNVNPNINEVHDVSLQFIDLIKIDIHRLCHRLDVRQIYHTMSTSSVTVISAGTNYIGARATILAVAYYKCRTQLTFTGVDRFLFSHIVSGTDTLLLLRKNTCLRSGVSFPVSLSLLWHFPVQVYYVTFSYAILFEPKLNKLIKDQKFSK